MKHRSFFFLAVALGLSQSFLGAPLANANPSAKSIFECLTCLFNRDSQILRNEEIEPLRAAIEQSELGFSPSIPKLDANYFFYQFSQLPLSVRKILERVPNSRARAAALSRN